MRKIILFFKFLCHIWKNVNFAQEIALKSPSEQDKRDLATGRWEHYKFVYSPRFVLNMDSEAEFLLHHYAIGLIKSAQFKIEAMPDVPVPFTGDELIARTKTMIYTCEAAKKAGKTIRNYLKELGVEVTKRQEEPAEESEKE